MFGVSVITASCQTSESISFLHEQSISFYGDFNIHHKNLTPFIDDGLLFVIDIKEVDFSVYWIWLGFYTTENSKSVFIEKITLIGNGLEKNILINKNLMLNKRVKRDGTDFNLLTTNIDPIKTNKNELLSFIDKSDKFKIEITYELDGKMKNKEFTILKKVEKRIVYPT